MHKRRIELDELAAALGAGQLPDRAEPAPAVSANAGDDEALQELARLVGADLPVPPDLQKRANAAVARAVADWKMPRRRGGRPPAPEALRIAVCLAARVLDQYPGRVSPSRLAGAAGVERRSVNNWVADRPERALLLGPGELPPESEADIARRVGLVLEAYRAGALDLVGSETEEESVRLMVQILAKVGVSYQTEEEMTADFDVISDPASDANEGRTERE